MGIFLYSISITLHKLFKTNVGKSLIQIEKSKDEVSKLNRALEVKEFEGDHILEFNDEILADTGWKEGDVLNWIDNKDGTWTSDDETKLFELEGYIKTLEKTKSKLPLPSQKETHQKLINEEQAKLLQLKLQKKELVGKTATEYASSRSNEDFLRNLLYKDSACQNIIMYQPWSDAQRE